MNKRLARLRGLFKTKKIDAVFITRAANRHYLSGFNGTSGYLFITSRKAVLATDFRYTEQAAREAPGFEIRRIEGNLADWFPDLIGDTATKKLGFESEDITCAFHRRLWRAIKDIPVKLVPVEGLVESLRAVKDSEEIEFISQASAIADAAMGNFAGTIRAGMTEKQVAWELEKAIRESGSQALPFEIIVASGPNAALPHHKPSDRIIRDTEPVVIDMGAKVGGYATDISHTVCTGRAEAQFRKIYNTVLEAQTAAIAGIRAGMTGHEADGIARDIIQKAGYGEAFGHALGHGVGLAEHEAPRLGPGSQDRLINGMVFTVEPGIYLPGWGGVRIEDTLVMEKGKLRPLTRTPKKMY